MFRPLRPIRPVRVMRPVGAPLVRGLVVGGAAYAAGRGAAERRRGEQDQNEAIAELQALQAQQAQPGQSVQSVQSVQQVAAPAPQAGRTAPGGAPDIADKLADLGRMTQQGLLTPEEFAAAKARLLGG